MKELNEDGLYRFTREVRAERTNALAVAVTAKNVYTGQRVRLTIRAGEPGVYRAAAPPR